MATTNDVTLRLKAQLDTTQLKQQLNELRKYQGNSNKGVSSGSTVNNGNVPTGGNLAVNINNAIVRLNQTLIQLNQSISRLYTKQGVSNTVSSQNNRVPYIGGGGGSVNQIPEFQKWQDNNFRTAIKIFRGWNSKGAEDFYNHMMSINLNDPNAHQKFFAQQFQSRINPYTPYVSFKKFLDSKEGKDYLEGKDYIERSKQEMDTRNSRRIMQVLGGMIINDIIKESPEALRSIGWNKTANNVSVFGGGASGGLQMGLATSMLTSNPYTIGVGIAVGAINGIVGELVKIAERNRTALENFVASVDSSTKKIKNYINEVNFSDFKRNMVRMDNSTIYTMRDQKWNQLNELKEQRTNYAKQSEVERREAMTRYLNGLFDAGTDFDDRFKVETQYAEELKRITDKEADLEKKIVETEREYDALNSAYDRNIKAIDQMTNIIKNAEKFDKSISDFNNGRVINQLIKDGRVGELTNQRNEIQNQISGVISKLSVIQGMGGLKKYEEGTNELRQKLLTTTDETEKASLRELIRQREKLAESYKENAEEMMKLTQKMDGLDNSIEQIKETSKSLTQSADNIIKSYTDRDESNALKTALYGIRYGANGRDLGKAPILQFREASKLLDHYREMMRQKEQESINLANKSKNEDLTLKEREDLIELSEKAKDEASRFASLVGQVESFISGINTNLQKPDLSNVTSLGQYGFSMGEKNDNINRLQKYYDNVENLVEQIRNKLNEGLKTTNTYN